MKLRPLKGVIYDRLILHDPPSILADSLRQQFTFKNPAYELAAKFSPWGPPKNMEEFIHLAETVQDTLVVPRGVVVENLSPKARIHWKRIKWVDKRIKCNTNYPEVLVTPNHEQTILLKDFQNAVNARKRPFGNFLYVSPTSSGKCLGKGVPVLLNDGSVKPVEKIRAGDLLMGPDSLPRKVLSTCSGREELYKVIPVHGEPYVVNKSHILSLKMTGVGEKYEKGSNQYRKGSVHNVCVTDYLGKSKTFKHCAKGWRIGVEFPSQPYSRFLPPYFLGIWLGDGSSRTSSITNIDSEIINYLREFVSDNGLGMRVQADPGKTSIYHITGAKRPKRRKGNFKSGREYNFVQHLLRKFNLIKNKHIPQNYLINDKKARLQLLAGLLDSDGYRCGSGYEITLVNKQLAEDTKFLARSLGLSAYLKEITKGCSNGVIGTYYRVNINGACSQIPCKVKRKQHKTDARRNVLLTGFRLQSLGIGDYYGFELDGDGLFLLGDFTVTHNTLFTAILARSTAQRTLVLCLTDLIKRSWYDDLLKGLGLKKRDIGLIQQGKWSIGEQFTLASVQTLARREHLWPELFKQIGCCIIDEAQSIKAPSVYKFIQECPAHYLIGMTATPKDNNFMLYSLLGNPRKRLISEQRTTQTSLALNFVETVSTLFQYPHDPSMLDQHDLAENLSMDEDRNKLIVHQCLKQWKSGESLLIVTKRVAHVHLLAEMLKEAGIDDVNVLTGGTNTDKEYTRQLVKGVLKRNIRCVVATIPAITLGANLNPISRLHLAMPVADKDTLEQLIGRIRRRADGKRDCGLIYYLDNNVQYLRSIFIKKATAVFRKLKTPGYANTYFA